MTLLHARDQFAAIGFDNSLAIPGTVDVSKPGTKVLQMRENNVQLGLVAGDTGDLLTTTVWGYGTGANTGILGPTLLAESGTKTTIKWQNQLPVSGYPDQVPVDLTLHRAEPVNKTLERGFVPTVVHLHGGETDARFDGYPEAWYTQTKGGPGAAETGEYYSGNTYTYDNQQEAATLWYHDHALGVTRLNVYSGLAGFYKLTDDDKEALIADGVLPSRETPLVIQDKAFTEDGKLYFPGTADDVLPDGTGGSGTVLGEVGGEIFAQSDVSALPEFFGDHILVNGTPWPNLDVSDGKETFNLLNGSDSRFYVLEFQGNVDVTAVGTDGGLLRNAVDLNKTFVMAPGDRIDAVVDFSALDPGDTVMLVNTGPAYDPFKGLPVSGAASEGATPEVYNIMQFTVDASLPVEAASVDAGTLLNPDIALPSEANVSAVRKVALFEGVDEFDRIQPLLGTAEEGDFHVYEDDPDAHPYTLADGGLKDFGPLKWAAPITETPTVGTTENWEVFNFTEDAHPVHLHLTQFAGLGRREFDFEDNDEDGIPDDTNGDGKISYGSLQADDFGDHDILVSETLTPLEPEEGGRQDTLYVGPGEMLELNAYFEKEGLYVWHCHILSHEDHEMMRPMDVIA